ncbi:MAG TPA: endonuclease V, partial [Dehalococcoidia bacterium]|nr:endonuclease V [Dehalococcoidia bacterium]
MRIRRLHPWNVTPAQAAAIQARLAPRVIAAGDPAGVRFVAGADIAFVDRPAGRSPSLARAAVVLLSYPELAVVEHHVVEAPVTFPYVPGLLAFREVPALARVFRRLRQPPDLLLVDGHGYSHPRRFGLACHLGLLLVVPTIGVAKSRLVGEQAPLGPEAGALAELRDGPDLIGLVLRSRDGGAPVYVSVGHRIGLHEAARWV